MNRKQLIGLSLIACSLLILSNISFTPRSIVSLELHCSMYHYREGELIASSHHPAVLTVGAQDWIEGKLADSTHANVSKYGLYIALSDDVSAPSSAWAEIPNEITGNGLDRALGSYASTGIGAWEVTYVFSPTADDSCRLTGLYWDSYATKSLVASDVMAVINYKGGTDTIEIVFQISAS